MCNSTLPKVTYIERYGANSAFLYLYRLLRLIQICAILQESVQIKKRRRRRGKIKEEDEKEENKLGTHMLITAAE